MFDIENFDSFELYLDYIENIYVPNAPIDVELLNVSDYGSGR